LDDGSLNHTDITGHNDPVTLNNVHGSSARLVDTAATLQHDHTDPGQSVPVPPLEEATFTCFNVDIDAMSHLFDADLYNSIIRNPILTTPGSYVAAISMLFSNFLDADRATCTMKLDIKSDVVTDFALTWFSVPLGTGFGSIQRASTINQRASEMFQYLSINFITRQDISIQRDGINVDEVDVC
jgi:hypothetical protein